MERELRAGLAAAGFTVTRCRCHEPDHIAEIRMTCGAGRPRLVAEVRRRLRRVVREIGSIIPRGGFNCAVRRNRVQAELVLT